MTGVQTCALPIWPASGPVMAEPFRPDLRTLPRDETLALVAGAMKKALALVE